MKVKFFEAGITLKLENQMALMNVSILKATEKIALRTDSQLIIVFSV